MPLETGPVQELNSAAESAVEPETRGFRLRPDPALSLDEHRQLIAEIRRRGFNLLVLDAFYDGFPLYLSEQMREWGFPGIHPRHKRAKELFFRVVECAAKQGLTVYVRAELLKLRARAGRRPHPILSRQPGWGVRAIGGKLLAGHEPETFHFLCPAHQRVRIFCGGLLFELVVSVPVSGVLLADAGFPAGALNPDTAACFCESCRTQVDSDLAVELASIHLDARDPNYERWTKWRVGAVDKLMKGLKMRVRKGHPQLVTGIEVPGGVEAAQQLSSTLMDWRNWSTERLVDFAAPVYAPQAGAAAWAELDRGVCLLPAGASLLPVLRGPLDAATAEGIDIIRRHPCCGFIVDRHGQPSPAQMTDPPQPQLAGHPPMMEAEPLASALQLLRITEALLPEKHELCSFFRDVQRVLEGVEGSTKADDLLDNLITNFQGLGRMIEDERLRIPQNAARISRNMSLIQRLLLLLVSRRLGKLALRTEANL